MVLPTLSQSPNQCRLCIFERRRFIMASRALSSLRRRRRVAGAFWRNQGDNYSMPAWPRVEIDGVRGDNLRARDISAIDRQLIIARSPAYSVFSYMPEGACGRGRWQSAPILAGVIGREGASPCGAKVYAP